MEATIEPVQSVQDRLAQVPAPPRSKPVSRVQSKVRAFVALVTRHASGRPQPDRTATKRTPEAVTSTEVTGRRASNDRNANATLWLESVATQSAVLRSEGQDPVSLNDPVAGLSRQESQSDPSSSGLQESSLLTTTTLSTSRTSVESEQSLTIVQGYWVLSGMPNTELQKLWLAAIHDRLVMELQAHVCIGGWVIEFCLLGRDRDDLKPHIVVTCTDRETKKQVEQMYRSLVWLRRIAKKHQLRFITLHAMVELIATGPLSSTNIGVARSTGHLTYCGSPVGEPMLERQGCVSTLSRSWRKCTLGGLIVADGQIYGITAGHCFPQDRRRLSASEGSLRHWDVRHVASCETETDSISLPRIFDENEELDGTATSLPSLPEQLVGQSEWAPVRDFCSPLPYGPVQPAIVQHVSLHPRLPRVLTHKVSSGRPSVHLLDWALVQLLPEPHDLRPSQILPNCDSHNNYISQAGDIPHEVRRISVLIERGEKLEGTLHPLPVTLKLGPQLYAAYRISLQVRLRPGFSGAWVLLDGKVLGHIIASRTDTPWAYMQPMRPILEDIRKELGAQDVRILPHDHPSLLEAANPGADSRPDITRVPRKSEDFEGQLPPNTTFGSSAQGMAISKVGKYPEQPKKSEHYLALKISSLKHRFDKSRRAIMKALDPKPLMRPIAGISTNVTYKFERFVVRHELRRKKLQEGFRSMNDEDENEQQRYDCEPYSSKSDRLFRLYNFSIAGTLNHMIKVRITKLPSHPFRRQALRLSRYGFIILFCTGYYMFCMPFHYWVKNKYREILDGKLATLHKRRKMRTMLGPYRHMLTYERRILHNVDLEHGADLEMEEGLDMRLRKRAPPASTM